MKDDADGLWVAEENERILGFAWSWVCGDMWFLAQLFVSPDQQGRSIGNELIKRTIEHAGKSGASNMVLITFSFNMVSQGLYIRHGLMTLSSWLDTISGLLRLKVHSSLTRLSQRLRLSGNRIH